MELTGRQSDLGIPASHTVLTNKSLAHKTFSLPNMFLFNNFWLCKRALFILTGEPCVAFPCFIIFLLPENSAGFRISWVKGLGRRCACISCVLAIQLFDGVTE